MKRDGFWFVFGLIVLGCVIYLGVQFTRGDNVCGKDNAKTWEWAPPHWECHA